MNETLGDTIKDTGDKIKDQERTEKLATYQEIQRLAEDSDKSQLEILI
jgi:hypothetical protein